jgi:hypothetical protein
VRVVGLGARSDLEAAKDFVGDTGVTSFPMVWDPTGSSWVDLGVASQPAGVLLGVDGRVMARWSGTFTDQEVLAALGPEGITRPGS